MSSSGIVRETDCYDILGLRPGCSFDEIKKAYKKLALQYHPDKNRCESDEQFKILRHAYEVLLDAKTRNDCDSYGAEGLNNMQPNSLDDSLDSLELRFNFQVHKMGKRETIIRLLPVTLEDLYNGCVRQMTVRRLLLCTTCTAEKPQIEYEVCTACKGKGKFHRPKNGKVEDKTKFCGVCNGAGKLIIPSYKCENCDGSKMVWNQFSINVPVAKGMKEGQSIIYKKEGNQFPDGKIGHLVFILTEAVHPVFKRSGYDLILKVEVRLEEAVFGFVKYIETLDGRSIEVHAYPGELFCLPGNMKIIMNEGMPIFQNPGENGALIIQFIIMPPLLQNFIPFNMFGFPFYQSEKILQNASAEIPMVSTVTSASETQIPADYQSASASTYQNAAVTSKSHESATVASETHQNIAADHHSVGSKTSQNSADISETHRNTAAASKTHQNIATDHAVASTHKTSQNSADISETYQNTVAASKTHYSPVEATKAHHKATTFTNYENEADIRVDRKATLSSRLNRSVAGIKKTRSSIFTIGFNLRKKPFKRSAASMRNYNKLRTDDEPTSAKKAKAEEEPMSTDEIQVDEEAVSANNVMADEEPMITNELEADEPLDFSFKIARM